MVAAIHMYFICNSLYMIDILPNRQVLKSGQIFADTLTFFLSFYKKWPFISVFQIAFWWGSIGINTAFINYLDIVDDNLWNIDSSSFCVGKSRRRIEHVLLLVGSPPSPIYLYANNNSHFVGLDMKVALLQSRSYLFITCI